MHPSASLVRMDKWLWAVRIFKTRSLATAACRLGHVTLGGQPVKPAREVKINEVLLIKKDDMTRTFKVLGLLDKRVGAPLAKQYVEDQTPESEFQKARDLRLQPIPWRPKGSGRPTKKERRDLDDVQE
ncbi:MAG TPA: RNA-binding S4 domain-containing protein [Candidatus Saccharimonadales bacterium]|nr:RNA-binding S4 domain-containing protein [Candidatus Saccharimonadales bacterium]